MPSARDFLRSRYAQRRQQPFIPFALFGLRLNEAKTDSILTPLTLSERPTAGEVALAGASPALSDT